MLLLELPQKTRGPVLKAIFPAVDMRPGKGFSGQVAHVGNELTQERSEMRVHRFTAEFVAFESDAAGARGMIQLAGWDIAEADDSPSAFWCLPIQMAAGS